jgi:hypothetical protein
VGPTYGFSIDSNGTLEYAQSSRFYACPSSDYDWNLYTIPVIGQTKCVEITLTASGCAAEISPVHSVTTVTIYNCGAATTKSSVQFITSPTTTFTTQQARPTVSPNIRISYTERESGSPTSIIALMTPTNSYPEITTTTAVSSSINLNSLRSHSESQSLLSYPESADIWSMTPAVATSYSWSPRYSTPSFVITVPSPTNITSYSHTYVSKPPSTTLITTNKPASPQYSSNAGNTTVRSSTYAIETSTTASSECVPTILTGSSTSGNYQYPHLIVPISSASPTTAYGTSYFGTISSNTSTLFNFDIPSSYSGKVCSLIFLLPLQSELETSSYTFSGSGGVEIEQLSSKATLTTTWDTSPSIESDLGEFMLIEGSSTLVQTFGCPAGETVTYEMLATGDTYLYYFQDWNPSPLGLYITSC